MNRLFATLIAALLTAGMQTTGAQQTGAQAEKLLASAQHKATIDGDLKGAIEDYQKIVATAGANRGLAAQALVRMAECYQKLGDAESRKIYERVAREFADQKQFAAVAHARLGAGTPAAIVRGDRAVWTGPDVDLFGQVSADGRYITWVDWAGDMHLMVHDLQTNTDRALTPTPSPRYSQLASFSAISKDSKQIAYEWSGSSSHYELRLLPISATPASEPRVLVPSRDDILSLSPSDWSRDGRWIAVNVRRADGTGQIGLVSTADGALRVLKSIDWRGANRIAFSLDDRYIAYDAAVGDSDAERHIFLLAIDGSRETSIVADRSANIVMGWSPDGRHLLFASDRSGETALWMQGVANGQAQGRPQLLKRDIGSSYSLGMTNAGTLFVYKSASANYVQVAVLDLDTARIEPAAGKAFQRFVGVGGTPSWSRDGRSLVYRSCGQPPRGVCSIEVASTDTGVVRQGWPQVTYLGGLRMADDGRSFFAVGRDVKGRRGHFRIDAQTFALKSVDSPRNGAIVHLSRDERTLFFRRSDPRGAGLFANDLSTGAEREVFRQSQNGSMTLSPDDQYIASVVADTLYLVPVAGGDAKIVLRAGPGEDFDGFRAQWTPDGRALVLPKTVKKAIELWIVPMFDAGAQRKIHGDTSEWLLPGGGFAIHPNGRQIAYTGVAGKQGAEVWALENFLPPQTQPGAQR